MSQDKAWAKQIVDQIASGESPQEITQTVSSAYYSAAMERVEDFKAVVGSNFFEDLEDRFKGPSERMKSINDRKVAATKDSVEKKRQNDELLKTGENAAGGPEADMYPGETPKRGAMGHMNPKGVPQRSYAGDRRPNANGPILPNEKGTVPNGSGV